MVVGDLSERETRKKFINPMLEQWGWQAVQRWLAANPALHTF